MKIANMKLLVGAFMALTLTMLSPAVLANDNNDIRKAVVVKFAKKSLLCKLLRKDRWIQV
jgi:hypothetical protein